MSLIICDGAPQPIPLFDMELDCYQCGDTGLWAQPNGTIATCPRLVNGAPHNEPSAAAKMFQRAVRGLADRKVDLDHHAFDVAKTLVKYSTANPCERRVLIRRHFLHVNGERSQIRKLQGVIEDLRRTWLLPVGSRKEEPSGYWIITDAADFAEWVERTKSAPIKQLSTIHNVAKRNFPVFAEQLDLEFWKDFGPDEGAAPDSAVV